MKKFEKFCRIALCAVFLAVIFGIFALTAYRMKTNYQGYSYFENRNLTPFPEVKAETVLDGTFFSDFEDWMRDHVAGRGAVLKYHTLLNMDVLRRPVVNEVVMADGVYLPYNKPETVDEDEIAEYVKLISSNLARHTYAVRRYGGEFYYVAVPCQYVCYEDSYPWYLNSRAEYTEKSCTALFAALDSLGVKYIDMKARFEELGNLPEFSSKVDNHFSIFGAYETYRAILERYNTETGAGLDVLDGDEYTVTELPNNYVGSRTRKLLGLRRTDEKLSLITPKVSVPFTRWDCGSDVPGEPAVYKTPQNEWEDVLYDLYMGGDESVTRIETDRPELPKILIYGDSFTNSVESIIWYNFDTMWSLDMRHYDKMTLDEFIEENKPDVVVCIRDYESLLDPYFNGQ